MEPAEVEEELEYSEPGDVHVGDGAVVAHEVDGEGGVLGHLSQGAGGGEEIVLGGQELLPEEGEEEVGVDGELDLGERRGSGKKMGEIVGSHSVTV